MVRVFGIALLILASSLPMTASAAQAILILRDGTLLHYQALVWADQEQYGQIVRTFRPSDPETGRLQRYRDATRIQQVAVDLVAGRIYVNWEGLGADHGVAVLDANSRKQIGFLPGVSKVFIPKLATEKHVVVEIGGSQDIDAPVWNDVSYLQFSRRTPELRKSGVVFPGKALFECEGVRGKGYPGTTSVTSLSEKLLATEGLLDTPERKKAHVAEGRERGYAKTCWPDGSLLRWGFNFDTRRLMIRVEYPDGRLGPVAESDGSESRVVTIGQAPAWVALDSAYDLSKAGRFDAGYGTGAAVIGASTNGDVVIGGRGYKSISYPDLDDLSQFPEDLELEEVYADWVKIYGVESGLLRVSRFPLGPKIDRIRVIKYWLRKLDLAVPCDAEGASEGSESGDEELIDDGNTICEATVKSELEAYSESEQQEAAAFPDIEIVGAAFFVD